MTNYLADKQLKVNATNLAAGVIQAVMAKAMDADMAARSEANRLRVRQHLTPGQRSVLAVLGLEREVQSGGFDSYFRYAEGSWCNDAIEGLRSIRADRHLAVVRRAVALFGPGGVPASIDTREQALDAFPESARDQLSQLNGEFYDAYSGVEEIAVRLIAFIVNHREQFFLP